MSRNSGIEAGVAINPGGLLQLLQLADSSFPTGAYAFSNGIEGLHAFGLVRDGIDLAQVIEAQIEEGLAGIELPAVFEAHRASTAGEVQTLAELDAYVTALKPVPAFNAASARVGRQFLEAALPLVRSPVVAEYARAVRTGQAIGHHPVAFGVVMAAGIDASLAAAVYGAGFVSGQVMTGVRLGIIGQGAAQRIIAGLRPELLAAVARAAKSVPSEMGAYLPLVDLAGLAQPTLGGRLFGS